MFDTVNRFDRFQNIFDRIVFRIFSCLDRQSFMSHILQSCHFFYNLFLGQFFPGDMCILFMIRTVYATVDTVIGQIQRCKKHDPVSVKFFFNLCRKFIHFLNLVRHLTGQQHRSLSVCQAFAFLCFRKDLVDQFHVVFICICISQGLSDLFIWDKFLGF